MPLMVRESMVVMVLAAAKSLARGSLQSVLSMMAAKNTSHTNVLMLSGEAQFLDTGVYT